MRISDWSSDVCSSDLAAEALDRVRDRRAGAGGRRALHLVQRPGRGSRRGARPPQGGGVDLRALHAGRAGVLAGREAVTSDVSTDARAAGPVLREATTAQQAHWWSRTANPR